MVKKLWEPEICEGKYRNPIIYADYSDPDVIRNGDDFYMVASSFSNAPMIPVLHSFDLINWRVVNYVAERLPFDSYDAVRHGCGAWAPSIRYHGGIYYVFVPFPDEGIAYYTANDPSEKWNGPFFVIKSRGWIDPCPFWDDDGKIYMVNAFSKSRIGFKSALYLSELKDVDGVLSADTDAGGFIYDGHRTQPTIEGPKLYKRDGYYYIFAPAGGVKNGWQTVLRSRNILGPYEERIVLRQGSTNVNGPHQGAWVDTPDGEDWFIHFQDAGAVGRIIHLQPMYWQNDWPVIGVNVSDGCGEPAMTYRKPHVRCDLPAERHADSDLFDGDTLGLQWQWNANPRKDWYSLSGSGLRLYTVPLSGRLIDAPNLMLQKWSASSFRLTVHMLAGGLRSGDFCGVVSVGGTSDGVFILAESGLKRIIRRTGGLKIAEDTVVNFGSFAGEEIYIKMTVDNAETVSWEVSGDGITYRAIGEPSRASAGVWTGVKIGVAAFSGGSDGQEHGYAEVRSFILESIGRTEND